MIARLDIKGIGEWKNIKTMKELEDTIEVVKIKIEGVRK